MATGEDWTADARRELLALACRKGGWAYRLGSSVSAEPSAMAGLALLSTRPVGGGERGEEAAIALAVDRLAGMQRPDGSVGVSASIPSPGWATPYALLFWTSAGAPKGRVGSAVRWLLEQKGRTLAPGDDPTHIAGHDTSLVGWPWVAETHSWLEPTAAAVLALGRSGLGGHQRVREGLRLVQDRAVASGGWNYGNKAVFGRPLRAQPAPTGLALLALSGTGPRSETIDRATRYLRKTLPGVRASASLGWGLLGLRTWGERPTGAARWLAEAHSAVSGRSDAAPGLALLLLAAGEHSLGLFGRSEPSAAAETPHQGGR